MSLMEDPWPLILNPSPPNQVRILDGGTDVDGRDRAGGRLAVAQLQVEDQGHADQLQNGEGAKNNP